MAATRSLSGFGSGIARIVMLAMVALAAGVLTIPAGAGGAMPEQIIAAQIRQQGFACENPQSAQRDSERSKPGAVVWLLTCENATYRVRLRPNMAADVEKVS